MIFTANPSRRQSERSKTWHDDTVINTEWVRVGLATTQSQTLCWLHYKQELAYILIVREFRRCFTFFLFLLDLYCLPASNKISSLILCSLLHRNSSLRWSYGMFWPRVCCSWALLLHGLSTKTLSQPRGLISPAATVILCLCLWKTKSQSSSAKTTTCRRSPWRINVRLMFWQNLFVMCSHCDSLLNGR